MNSFSPSFLLNHMETLALETSPERNPQSALHASESDIFNECCICLDRKPEILLPCTHTYCCPCIEQWFVFISTTYIETINILIMYYRKMTSKTCPICQEKLDATDDSWVLTDLPDMQEVNEEIYTELQGLSKN